MTAMIAISPLGFALSQPVIAGTCVPRPAHLPVLPACAVRCVGERANPAPAVSTVADPQKTGGHQ